MAKKAKRRLLDIFRDPFDSDWKTSPDTYKLDESGHMFPAWNKDSPAASIASLRDWINDRLADGDYKYGADIDDLNTADTFLGFAEQCIAEGDAAEAYNIGLMIGMYLGRYEAREKLAAVEQGEKYSETQGDNRRGKGTLSNEQWRTVIQLRDSRLTERTAGTAKTDIYLTLSVEICDGLIDGIPAGTDVEADTIGRKKLPTSD